MAESMVERVKDAIAAKFACAIDFRAPYAKIMLDAATRAAIAAMREPTEAYIKKLNDGWYSEQGPPIGDAFKEQLAEYIDAALADHDDNSH